MGSTIQQATEQQGYRMRADRRPTQGQVASVDKITQTCTVDIKFSNTQGDDVYMEEISYQPQHPPSVGDNVTIGYTNASPHSAIILGSQLSGQNTTDTLQVVGGVSSLRLSTETTGTKGDLVLTAGAGIVITRAQGNFNISAPAGAFAPATTTPAAIAAASALGTDTGHFALADHTHQGVHSLGVAGSSSSVGDVKLHAGTNITLTPVSDGIQIDAAGGSGGTGGLTALAVYHNGAHVGDYTSLNFVDGTNATITPATNASNANEADVTVASSGGSGATGAGAIVEYAVFVSGGSSSPFQFPQIAPGGSVVPYVILLKNKFGGAVTLNTHTSVANDKFEDGTHSNLLNAGAYAMYVATQTASGFVWVLMESAGSGVSTPVGGG